MVSFEEKGYYRVVSVGQLTFDCRSYCGRSRRMQGSPRKNLLQMEMLFSSQMFFSSGVSVVVWDMHMGRIEIVE